MASVEQSVEVEVPLADAQRAWSRFIDWVLVGKYRLVCDVFSCERMADRRTVTFSSLGERRSLVAVAFEFNVDSSADPAEKAQRMNARLAQDLMKFREFVRSELGKRGNRRSDRKDRSRSGDRAGRLRLTTDSVIERDHDDLFGSPHYLA